MNETEERLITEHGLRLRHVVFVGLLVLAIVLLTGCGSSTPSSAPSDPPPSDGRAMVVTPSSVDLFTEGEAEFTALVGEADGSEIFAWTATCGDVSPTGSTVAYTAPEIPTLCTVGATLSGTTLEARARAVVTELPDGELVVRITDAATFDPLEATLVVTGGGDRVFEGTTSSFSQELRPGPYVVTVSATGYTATPPDWAIEPRTASDAVYERDVTIRPDNRTALNVRLYPDDYEAIPERIR